MEFLNRDRILAAQDLRFEEVEIPEWEGTVRVRGLTGAQRDQYEAEVLSAHGRRGSFELRFRQARAKLVAMSVVDAEGNLLFSEGDVAALGGKSARALDRIFDVAARLSGLTGEEVEELVRDFPGGPSDGSGSA